MAACSQIWCGRRRGAVYILVLRQQKETVCHAGQCLNIGDLKAHPHSDTLPLTRPHLPILPLPMSQAFKHLSLWRPFLFKPPHHTMHITS